MIKRSLLLLSTRFYSNKHHNMPKKSKSKGDKGADKAANVTKAKGIQLKGPIKIDSDKNVLIEVYAKPGAKQNAIVDVSDEGIGVQINAPPVEGSANTELIKYMASFLGLKSSHVSLERGHKSRNKVLKISGNVTKIDIVRKINAELPDQSKLPEED